MDYSDLTYLAALPSIYSVLEPALAITLACVPLLRPLFGGKYSVRGTRIGPGSRSQAARSFMAGGTIGAVRLSSNNRRHRARSDSLEDAFADGHDDASQIELCPTGNKYVAQISTKSEALETAHVDGRTWNTSAGDGHGVQNVIVVRQEWEVKET